MEESELKTQVPLDIINKRAETLILWIGAKMIKAMSDGTQINLVLNKSIEQLDEFNTHPP